MSKLLLDEQPLLVMPKLATKIGLNEAIVLQQVHYWNEINKNANNNFKDGHCWTFNSYENWKNQFPFWSKRTIQRTITNLENMKLLIVGNYNKLKIDRTKWYRIDYEVLTALEESPFSQIGTINMTQWLSHLDNLGLPLPETNSENKSETKHLHLISENEGYVFQYYSLKYKETFGKEHPLMTDEKLEELQDNYYHIRNELDIVDDDTWEELVDYHFRYLIPSNDGNILSFLALNGGYGCVYRYMNDLIFA